MQYDFLEEMAEPITDVPDLDVPFSASGWRYAYGTAPSGWQDPTFDDSGWSLGQMPIGNSAYASWPDDAPNTIIPDPSNPNPTDVFVRRQLGPGTNITFDYRMARYMSVWIDGTLLSDFNYGNYHSDAGLVIPDQTGIWTLAIRIHDFNWGGAGPSFDIGVNAQIAGDEA